MTETAQTYGGALYELSRDEGISGEILKELDMAVRLFDENPRYAQLLSLPSVPKKERCEILNEGFRGMVHTYLLSFLKILVENGTVRELVECTKAYRTRYYEDNGIMAVTAVSAVPLSDELRDKLCKKLASVTKKKIELTARVDGAVLGGLRLEMDGRRLDGTVRSRLDEIQKTLRETVL